jgi:hypothetical protein
MCFPMEKAVEEKWYFEGLQCVVTRVDLADRDRWSKHRCGYVSVPPGHPWHGQDYDDIGARVHGALTFAKIEPCEHEDGTGYWIGFDCAHSGDRMLPHGEAIQVEILAVLRDNRSKHRAIFEEALAGYKKQAVELLEEKLAAAKNGKVVPMIFSLPQPMDQTKEYDRAIRMLEMAIAEEIELSETDFQWYVLDDWSWRHSWHSNEILEAIHDAEAVGLYFARRFEETQSETANSTMAKGRLSVRIGCMPKLRHHAHAGQLTDLVLEGRPSGISGQCSVDTGRTP